MQILKEAALAVLFFAAAGMDLRNRRVPNRLLLSALAVRLLFLVPELYRGGASTAFCFLQLAAGSLVLTALLALAAGLAERFTGGRLGMGDVKFVGTAALYTGAERMLGILLAGLLLAVGVVLLNAFAGKRKRMKMNPGEASSAACRPVYPLLPFLLGGYILELLVRR